MQPRTISPISAKTLCHAGVEVALLDVREAGEFADGHTLLSVSVPISRFECELARLVPRRETACLLIDDGSSGRAEFARRRAQRMGYSNLAIVEGGTRGWRTAGLELFEGVHVLSKAFGEVVEAACQVPHISAAGLREMLSTPGKVLLLDGRPLEEHGKMNIPGSICLPNGELAYRIGLAARDEAMPIVVHCAGRTRSIIGAETIRALGLPNPVFALENGTQGWTLSGFPLEHGSKRAFTEAPGPEGVDALRRDARRLARNAGVPIIDDATADAWLERPGRTLYVFDVRSPAEHANDAHPGAAHAPGGQLVQATDLWVAVRSARIILIGHDLIRPVMTARWLRQMGLDAVAFDGLRSDWPLPAGYSTVNEPAHIALQDLKSALADPNTLVLDVRPSMIFRRQHIAGARWTTRSRASALVAGGHAARILLVPDKDETHARLLAGDLIAQGYAVALIEGDADKWVKAGIDLVTSPSDPPDSDCIDFVFFTHDRHSGNLAAARQYIAWERGLVARLDPEERRMFSPQCGPGDMA